MLRRMWRKVLRGLGCLAYLGVLGVLFALTSYLAFNQFVRRGVTPTPDLLGLDREGAVSLLTDQGLRLEWGEKDDRYDEEMPAGHVLVQRPGAGTLVKRGSAIEVILSRGPQRIEVPAVKGSALQAAQVTLRAAGLTLGQSFGVYSRDVESGAVVDQFPSPGERLERSGSVSLLVSLERTGETYVMPDLVDQPFERVRGFFESRGFRLGRVSYETYAGLAPGTVLRQFPQAGHPLRRGDVIALGVVAAPESGIVVETGDGGTAGGTEPGEEPSSNGPPAT